MGDAMKGRRVTLQIRDQLVLGKIIDYMLQNARPLNAEGSCVLQAGKLELTELKNRLCEPKVVVKEKK